MRFVKHAAITFLILVLIGCVAFWVLVDRGHVDVSADGEHWPVTSWLLTTARESAVARQAQGIPDRLPDLSDRDELLATVIAYEDMCAACHTPPGGSPTVLAQGLNPPPPELSESAPRLDPEELFWVAKHGIRRTGMPAWGLTHDDDDLWPIIALITRFPDFGDDDYQDLLEAAREVGVEHQHGDDDHHQADDDNQRNQHDHSHEDLEDDHEHDH